MLNDLSSGCSSSTKYDVYAEMFESREKEFSIFLVKR